MQGVLEVGAVRAASCHQRSVPHTTDNGHGRFDNRLRPSRRVAPRTYRTGLSLDDQSRAGYLLNTGSEAYKIDDRIYVRPIDRPWQTNRT